MCHILIYPQMGDTQNGCLAPRPHRLPVTIYDLVGSRSLSPISSILFKT